MGQQKFVPMVIFSVLSLALVSLVVDDAFAGFDFGPLSASPFGPPQTPVVVPVPPGACPGSPVSVGCVLIDIGISYDPGVGPMVKLFDLGAVLSATGPIFSGDVIHVGEALFVLPLGGNPTGEWSDWHEQIITPGWEWQSFPPPGIFPSNGAVMVTDLSSNPQELWLDFDPPILSTDSSPELVIEKYLVCVGIPFCIGSVVEVHQFPTLDIDFGDLIDPSFPTLLASDGARHFPAVLNLGVIIDTEPDGQPSPLADKDDLTGADDEDNISFTSPIIPGATASVDIIVTGGTGVIDAWIDFNSNGVFDLPTEKLVFSPSAAVSGGTNSKTFPVPAGASLGISDSRWRVSTTGAPLPTGYVPDGEVEDHRFTISTGPPIGGELVPIDTTALLLIGAQSTASWMIPVVVAGIGIGLVVLRKFKN